MFLVAFEWSLNPGSVHGQTLTSGFCQPALYAWHHRGCPRTVALHFALDHLDIFFQLLKLIKTLILAPQTHAEGVYEQCCNLQFA